MKIGFAAPASLAALIPHLDDARGVPQSNAFPQASLLILELLRRGHTVSLFTLDPSMGHRTLTARGKNLSVHLGGYHPKGHVRATTRFRRERRTLGAFMQQDPCEVLHAHWTYEYAWAALRADPAALVTVRDWAPAILQMQRRVQDRYYRLGRLLMSERTLALGRRFTSPSPYIARLVEGKTAKPCTVVPNALPDAYFSPPSAAWERRPNERAPVIVSINNGFDRRKNVSTLIEAFAELRRALPGARLKLVGSAYEDGGAAHLWAKQRALEAGLEPLGPRPYADIHALLAEADLLVHPSLEESFGMTLVEAMAKGVPVVAGRHSGAVPWVLGEGRAGVLTDVASPRAIAEACLGLLTDPARWREVAAAGYQHASATFRLSQTADRYLEAYREALEHP